MILTRDPIIRETKKVYGDMTRQEKTVTLNTFATTFKRSRKRLIAVFTAPDEATSDSLAIVGRPVVYTKPVEAIIVSIWKQCNYPSSIILKAQIPIMLPSHKKHVGLIPDPIEQKVLAASARTIDRMLAPYRAQMQPHGRATTRSRRTPLQQKIPIRTGQWEIKTPGYLEGDLVSHCGGKAAEGHFYTFNTTDIDTQWFSARPLASKREEESVAAIKSIEHHLPFDLRGADFDNGTEFINELMLDHFTRREKPIEFTRSRAYKKNDNAHIEQKNWQNIRRYLAYGRFDQPKQFVILKDLLQNDMSDFLNFFVPVRKVIAKERVGSRTRKLYDAPRTPYQRVLASGHVPQANKDLLRKKYGRLDPYLLQKSIWNKIDLIYRAVRPADW